MPSLNTKIYLVSGLVAAFIVSAVAVDYFFLSPLRDTGNEEVVTVEVDDTPVVIEVFNPTFFDSSSQFSLDKEASALEAQLVADVAVYQATERNPLAPQSVAGVRYGDKLGLDFLNQYEMPIFASFLTAAFADLRIISNDLTITYLKEALPPHLRHDEVVLRNNRYAYTFPPAEVVEVLFLAEILAMIDSENAEQYSTAPDSFLQHFIAEGMALPGDIVAARSLVAQYIAVVESDPVVTGEWLPALQRELASSGE